MGDYDIALKEVLRGLTASAFRLVTGADEVVRWCNVELPKVQTSSVDLLGKTADGRLIQVEFQSRNDADMGLRMLSYALDIRKAYGRFPEQVVVFTGGMRMKMPDKLEEAGITCRYRLVDIRKIDGEPLLASPRLEDNVIAVLMRLADQRAAVRRILRRIAKSRASDRHKALTSLEVLAGLRKLGRTIVEETEEMPILDDIMDHDVLGPKYREGVAHGKAEGERQMALRIARQMVEKRFGPIPKWAERRLGAMSVTDIQSVSLRLFDATTLKDLFR